MASRPCLIWCLPVLTAAIAIATPAPAAACGPELELVAARGSSESPQGTSTDYSAANRYGMGGLLFGVYDQFANLVGRSRVSPYGVHYPAVSVTGGADWVNGAGAFLHIGALGDYTSSVEQGTLDTLNHIRVVHAACATTKFILVGYSQGAQAVADALEHLSAQGLSLVAGAAFLGDPYFNADSWASMSSQGPHYGSLGVRDEFPAVLRGRVFSYCQLRDPVCSLSDKHHILGDGDIYTRNFGYPDRSFAPHSNYGVADGPDAARRLARAVGASTPPTGAVPLDLAFAIDTTGSMGGIIGQVRDNIQALARSIASTSSNYRFALVDYKDFGDVYQARVDLPFSTDVGAFSTAASALQASGGGDYPESMYSGIMTALGLSWRPGVRKVVLVIGDAPGKDPEPGTGYTLAQVRDRALAVDPAQVYAVSVSSDPAVADFMRAVADATGGQLTDAPDQATFVSKLQETIAQAGSAPVADLGGPYEAVTGDPVTLTAGGSRDESEDIVSYDWDFDGDGTYDETTTDPVAHHAYPVAGSVTAVVRVRARSGLAATATAQVTVADPPAQPPAAPQDLTGAGGDGTVTLAWQAATTGEPASWFTITDADGNVIDLLSAGPGGSAPIGWVQTDLTNGQSYGYKVSAGNIVGSSPFAGPVTVTPRAPDTSSSGQRLALVAGGHPPLVVIGRVIDGGFTVSLSRGSLERLAGTAHVDGRSVTLSVVRRGASWSATARVTGDRGTTSLTGDGTVRSAGRVVKGHFRAARGAHPWGFSLTRPAGRRQRLLDSRP
jgi:predicted esterase